MTRAAAIALALAAMMPAVARADAATSTPMTSSTPATPAKKPLPPVPPSEPDDAAVDQASDANFDEDAPRHGFVAAIAVGPDQQIGKIDQSTGLGVGFSVRLGAAASRRVRLLFQIDGTTYVKTYEKTPGGPKDNQINSSAAFTIGSQLFLRDAVWVRFGAGFSGFNHQAGENAPSEHLYSGLGGQLGAGVNVMRRERLAFSIELTIVGAKYREGSVFGGFLGVGLAYD